MFLFAFVSAAYAFLLSEPRAAAIAAGIVAAVVIRSCVFLSNVKKFISETEVSRDADAHIIKQGGIIAVRTSVTFPDAKFSYTAEDLYPAGAVLVSGSTVFENGSANYRIKMPLMGKSEFGGVLFKCRDLFISSNIVAKNASAPKIVVYPTGIASTLHRSVGTGVWVGEEMDRIAIIAGTETRSFRKFAQGDNVKDIDWKMSARYDELYTRERADASGDFPMILFDLPSVGTQKEVTADFLNAAEGVLELVRMQKNIPAVFICGADFIATAYSEDYNNINDLLSSAGKIKPNDTEYRIKHRTDLKTDAAALEDASPTEFSKRLKTVKSNTATRYLSDFEKRSINIAGGLNEVTSVYVVTAGADDVSHIIHIIKDLVVFGKTVSVNIAGTKHTNREEYLRKEFANSGVGYIEVVS